MPNLIERALLSGAAVSLAVTAMAQPVAKDAPGGRRTANTVSSTGAQPATGDTAGGGAVRLMTPTTGEQSYRQICQGCHMADARGGSGAGTIPALAGNMKLAAAGYPILVVTRGQGAMPSFAGMLDPKQVAEVLTYVRTHFGNSYAKPVTAEEVQKLWPAPVAADH